MLIFGIETSCDETGASVVENGYRILSNIVSSSLRYHKRFGGVIPEIAARHHVENIDRVIKRALSDARCSLNEIDAISVTSEPGLPGALLIGIACAEAIGYALRIPIIKVDHLEAHIYSAIMTYKKDVLFPFIGLVVSGGHTRLFLVRGFKRYKIIGDTIDDAIGEAYDKVAKILGLGYPGGPIIDNLAKKGNPDAIRFKCNPIKDSFDVSFSGIKTAVLYYVRSKRELSKEEMYDIVASFQERALDAVITNSINAMRQFRIRRLVVGGGVSANSRFRERLNIEAKIGKFEVYFPASELCSDNAAMVAGLGYHMLKTRS